MTITNFLISYITCMPMVFINVDVHKYTCVFVYICTIWPSGDVQ